MNQNHGQSDLKRLRQERKFYIERARQMVKERNKQMTAVKSTLKEAAATVPQIAEALKMESAEVLLIISALRKYGEVVEGAKADDYFTYQLSPSKA
jgi:biotin operon repressor